MDFYIIRRDAGVLDNVSKQLNHEVGLPIFREVVLDTFSICFVGILKFVEHHLCKNWNTDSLIFSKLNLSSTLRFNRLERFKIGYSMKNIPLPSYNDYLKEMKK